MISHKGKKLLFNAFNYTFQNSDFWLLKIDLKNNLYFRKKNKNSIFFKEFDSVKFWIFINFMNVSKEINFKRVLKMKFILQYCCWILPPWSEKLTAVDFSGEKSSTVFETLRWTYHKRNFTFRTVNKVQREHFKPPSISDSCWTLTQRSYKRSVLVKPMS